MNFKKKILGNGLTVLFEKREVPVTTVMLGVKYGSAYETEEEKGIAHFIEHLCFKGTEKRTAKEIAEAVEKVGGDLNAFTHEEITAYHVKLPSEHLKIAMEIIFDIFFNPLFPDDEVKKESNVICEEIRMYEDNPRSHVLEKIKSCLYEKPFGMFIAGTEENVRRMEREKLYEKHRSIYVPKNSVLCVVGNNNFEEILEMAEKFSVSRDGQNIKLSNKIIFKNLEEVEQRDNLQQANLAIGFHFPFATEKERYSAEIFSAILGQGMSSKLFTEVREKRGLVYGVKSNLDLGKNYGYLFIWAGTDKDKVNEVIEICLKEFKKMKNISEKELIDAKIQAVGNYIVSSEDSNNTAVNLILEESFGDSNNYYEYKKNINNVSLDDIKKLAENVKYSYFVLTP